MGENAVKTKMVNLLYGRQGLQVRLPGICQGHWIRKGRLPVLQDLSAACLKALNSPVGCPPLREVARGGRTACILVCDITRPVPNASLLPPVLAELGAAGVGRDQITVLIATGLHRAAPEEEKRSIVGDEAYSEVRVENHHAEDDASHVRLGMSSGGIPALLDRRFVEAEVRIVTGLVEPHFMAGYSGGRKVVVPGVAHRDTILPLHAPPLMEHPRATSCVLDDNPLHREQLEIAGMVGPVFGVNVVLDEERRGVFVSAGALVESHLQAVEVARRISEVRVGRKFHTILTSAGGFPLDKTYYQTIKGMVTPLGILEPGGTVVVVSECSEGVGSAGFRDAQVRLVQLGPQGFLAQISSAERPKIDQWQTEKLAQALCRAQIHLYAPTLPELDWGLLGVHRARDPMGAVEEAVARSGDVAVAVIPEGPYVIPFP
ncbi:MAG: nickel-dependent lactate racemase [Deferrisomatales bacterium]|nr:nickel-dependent lactate racemase [Deferrisomatales bacterium]